MLRASFIPSRPQRQLRDLTRCRRTLTQERTREKQRAEKLLEDAQIKLSSVISDIFGVSGRAMLDALAAGQRNPHALAALAYRNMRAKTSVLQEALTGHFTDHHAFMLGMMLARIEALTTQIATLTTRIGEAIAPLAAQVAQLDEIPGIGVIAAQDIIAEVGTDMSASPPQATWCPGPSSRPGPPVRRPQQGSLHRQGQPLAWGHPRRSRRRRRPDQDLPDLLLQADRQAPQQEPCPGRCRQLHPHHHLAPAARPRRPLHRPGPRLA
jgi:transposase